MKRISMYILLFIVSIIVMSCVSNNGFQQQGNRKQSMIESVLRRNTVRISVMENNEEVGSGSGFVITYKQNYYVITNFHVIGYKNEKNIAMYMTLEEGKFIRLYNTSVVVDNEDHDLAILTAPDLDKIDGLIIQPACSLLQLVIVAGFPKGAEEKDITFSTGKISNPRVIIEDKERIKLDIAVNPGNSGGPLVNDRGEVLGVIYMKYTSDVVDNVAYAIPINLVLNAIDGIEERDDEKLVTDIVKVRLEQFMSDLLYSPSDSCISTNFFTYDFRLSINSFFSDIFTIGRYIKEVCELDSLPKPSNEDFKEAVLKLAQDNEIFDTNRFGTNINQKYRLVDLGCQAIYNLEIGSDTLIRNVSELSVSQEKKIEYSRKLIEYHTSVCAKKLFNDIVYAHFEDSKDIESFQVVKIIPDTKNNNLFYGVVRIKYIDGFVNVKIEMNYSRGKWSIASIGDGVLEETGIKLITEDPTATQTINNPKSFTSSPNADQLVSGNSVPYHFWVDDSKWEVIAQKTNPDSDYEFMCKDALITGFIIAEKVYVPVQTLYQVALHNAIQAAPGARIIHKEQRIVNGAEMLFVIIDTPMDQLQLNYVMCYYLYTRESFGSVQIMAATLKELYDNNKDNIYEFLNGIVVLGMR